MSYEKNNNQNESQNYSILESSVLKSNLKPTTKLVYAAIASHYRGEMSAIYPSYNRIAGLLGISRNTAIVAVRELVAAGLLKKVARMRDDGGFTSNIYTLTPSNLNALGSNQENTNPSNQENTSPSNLNAPRNKDNPNNNINLKIYNTRAHARENAAAAVHDAAEETARKNKDLQVLEIFKQTKNSKWFELVRINQSYCLRPYSEMSLRMVQNAEFNSLCDVITQNTGSCRPLNVGQHFLDEVIIK